MAALTTGGKVKLLIGILISLVSLILGVIAYSTFAAKTEYYDGVVKNWKTDPVNDMQFRSGPCVSPFEKADTSLFTYTLTVCDCSRAQTPQNTTLTACTQTQRTANCTNVDQKKSKDVSTYLRPGLAFCIRRVPGANALARNRPGQGKPCPAGSKPCNGLGDCFPEIYDCPITSFKFVGDVNSPIETAGYNFSSGVTNDTLSLNSGVVFNRGDETLRTETGLPVTQVTLGPFVSSTGAPIVYQDANLATGFTNIYSVQQQIVLESNPPAQAEMTADGVWTSINQRDVNVYWTIQQRREIQWGQVGAFSCPQTREAVTGVQDEVKTIVTCQLIVMIVGIIVFIFNVALTWKEWKDRTDDKPDNDDIAMKQRTRCGLTGETINLIPTIVALAVAYSKLSFFNSIKANSCSDPVTNKNIGDLAETISKIGTINIIKFCVTFPYFLYRLWKFCKGDKDPSMTTKTAETATATAPAP